MIHKDLGDIRALTLIRVDHKSSIIKYRNYITNNNRHMTITRVPTTTLRLQAKLIFI